MTGRRTVAWTLTAALMLYPLPVAQAQMAPGNNGAGRPVAGQTRFFHRDPAGSVTVVTDSAGKEAARVVQTPYGALDIRSSGGTDDFRPKFAGKESDERSSGSSYAAPGTNLSYFGARYYSPALGRFVSPDPAREFSNPYSYGMGNPVTVGDPSGMIAVPLLESESPVEAGSTAAGSTAAGSTAAGSTAGVETAVVEAGATTGPLDLAIIAALVIVDVALLVVAASPAAGTAPATEGGYSAPVIPGTWAAAGSSRVSQALNPIQAPYALPSASGPPPAAGSLPGLTVLTSASANAANQLGLPGAGSRVEVCPPIIGSSLLAGTRILTPDGSVPIEDLRVGDTVVGYDERSGKLAPNTVTQLFTRVATDLVTLRLEGGPAILTTARHPFLVNSKGWREASALAAGDVLTSAHGPGLAVATVERDTARELRVFNVEVAPDHIFLVGPEAVVVHNVNCSFASYHQIYGAPPNIVQTPLVNYHHIDEYSFDLQPGLGLGGPASVTGQDWADILADPVLFYYANFTPTVGNSFDLPSLLPNLPAVLNGQSLGYEQSGYDRGHILARQNGGSGNTMPFWNVNSNHFVTDYNIFAQSTLFNRARDIPQGTLVDPTLSTFTKLKLLDPKGKTKYFIKSGMFWRAFEDEVNVSGNGTLTVWLYRKK